MQGKVLSCGIFGYLLHGQHELSTYVFNLFRLSVGYNCYNEII